MAKRDTNTYEELMMRTVSIIETIPDRIKELEKEVSSVKQDFSYHDGEQRQGIKRTDERIINLDKDIEEVKNSIATIKHLEDLENCPREVVKNAIAKVELIQDAVKDIEEEVEALQALYEEMRNKVDTLYEEYEHKEENKKTIKSYASEAAKSFIRYAMLPICIIILLKFGVDAKYIPWYKDVNTVNVTTRQNKALNNKIKSLYEKNNSKYILEGDILRLYYNNAESIVLVHDSIFNKYEYPKEKIILWLPESGDGYLYFGDNKLLIKRR